MNLLFLSLPIWNYSRLFSFRFRGFFLCSSWRYIFRMRLRWTSFSMTTHCEKERFRDVAFDRTIGSIPLRPLRNVETRVLISRWGVFTLFRLTLNEIQLFEVGFRLFSWELDCESDIHEIGRERYTFPRALQTQYAHIAKTPYSYFAAIALFIFIFPLQIYFEKKKQFHSFVCHFICPIFALIIRLVFYFI